MNDTSKNKPSIRILRTFQGDLREASSTPVPGKINDYIQRDQSNKDKLDSFVAQQKGVREEARINDKENQLNQEKDKALKQESVKKDEKSRKNLEEILQQVNRIEEEKNEIIRSTPTPPRQPIVIQKNRPFVVPLALLLFIIGLGVIVFSILHFRNERVEIVPEEVRQESVIPTPGRPIEVNVTDGISSLTPVILNQSTNEVFYEYTPFTQGQTASQITGAEFLAQIPRSPISLSNNTDPYFFIGSLALSNQSPGLALLFYIYDFDLGYGNLLEWEDTIASNFSQVFPGLISSESGKFFDKIINNRDTRTYVTNSGKEGFTHGFITNHWLLITSNPPLFGETLDRFLSKRQ